MNRTSNRTPMTREEVARLLLGRIIAGDYKPGQRLPGQARLRPRISPTLSMTTLNSAIGILKDLGYLTVRLQHSTCVADPLPYRNRYAITLPNPRDPAHPTTFASVLHRLAMERQHNGGNCEYVVFSGTNSGPEQGAVLNALADELRWHRVAGVMFGSELWSAPADPFFTEPGIARAALSAWIPAMLPMPRVVMDQAPGQTFMTRSLEWLREQGCKTTAIVTYQQTPFDATATERAATWKPWNEALAEHGVGTRPHWLLPIAGGGYELAQLLMRGRETPEAIIITDDILVPSVTEGLLAAGPLYPKVVALANYPVLPRTHVPARFLGHDVEAIFDWCAASLRDADAQRTCPVFSLPTIFEEEWRTSGRFGL
jgi:hypothetical protein